jgi:UDP-2,3-diacylglucosamine pyrophosphatase LpxH
MESGSRSRRKTMKILRTIVPVMFLSLLASCIRSNSVGPANSVTDPFANGSGERNMIVVMSDFHLGADLAYAEINKNLKPLENFLEKVRMAPAVKELVIAGDMLDEWFVPATTTTYGGKDQSDFVRRIAASNKGVIDAFNRIIQEGEISVTYVPGNHDLSITAENVAGILPGINQARDEEQGLGTYSPTGHPEIAIEHGHRYNFMCAPDPISNKDIAPGSILPPGYFFTRIATLHVVQKCHTAGDTLPVVTRNSSGDESQNFAFVYWNLWKTLMTALPVENKYDDKIIVTNVGGFTETYAIKDLMPNQLSAGGVIDVTLFKGIQDTWDERQTLNNVAVHIPVAEAILNASSSAESDHQATIQYFLNPGSDKRIVVFGHTHHAILNSSENYKGEKSIYVNSGTWIDHQQDPGLTTMNFVVIRPQTGEVSSKTWVNLYNFEGEVVTRMAVDSVRL